MMDYIKKLRACIRAFQELDTNHTREHLDLSKQIEDERQCRLEAGFPSYTSFYYGDLDPCIVLLVSTDEPDCSEVFL